MTPIHTEVPQQEVQIPPVRGTSEDNPIGRFSDAFAFFNREYSIHNKIELKQSHETKKAPWNPMDGVQNPLQALL